MNSEQQRRNAGPVSVNRLRFANEVEALDPRDPCFVERVTELNAQYAAREDLTKRLRGTLRTTDGGAVFDGIIPETSSVLLLQLDAAIERFVVGDGRAVR
ncbi:hypothetical protein [uncultured Paludibaculum sp.]|uniref:hypothetical protein n=1 Tax=uncultured Paludibaculum sp. TaxID=1765020 RepID=UPI002AAB8296|nr:hypothetical protein [uncultured Paludibaculum sp.]